MGTLGWQSYTTLGTQSISRSLQRCARASSSFSKSRSPKLQTTKGCSRRGSHRSGGWCLLRWASALRSKLTLEEGRKRGDRSVFTLLGGKIPDVCCLEQCNHRLCELACLPEHVVLPLR
ncbi:hypothetical protein VPH35_019854 [Triticum aestivum]